MKNKRLPVALIASVFVFIALGHPGLATQSQDKLLQSPEPLLVKIIKEETPEPLFTQIIKILGPILLVLAGAVGPTILFYLQLKNTRRSRMDQVMAEKKIMADGEAYSRMKTIQAYFFTEDYAFILTEIMRHQNWLLDNRLFLPGKFVDKWMTIRNGVEKAIRSQKISDELKKGLGNKIEEAIREIYKDVGIGEIKIEPLDTDKEGGKKRGGRKK